MTKANRFRMLVVLTATILAATLPAVALAAHRTQPPGRGRGELA